jgi:hypothetical protein
MTKCDPREGMQQEGSRFVANRLREIGEAKRMRPTRELAAE